MSLDRMIEKAYRLLEGGRVEEIGRGLYHVVGDHGTYTVVLGVDGRVTCSCLGFARRRRCSHSLAVLLLSKGLAHGRQRKT